ncbi:hypothetical protein BCR43DRAFT_489056 [Syncephalastrum racemosum]|uniref:sn-1-specific diacylglycerol lipase n=1 Tax=Syncephalastrum racemosum TaxID=13706 RepID=A0A1X2HJS2_SYNRA|nr:hypothetical protein BCR43DRAFT_489056 [Syncephalastrum racemosum]
MGDQRYETSVSEYSQGKWHESFEFTVTFHAQLFDTIQMDLYDAYMLLPDRHVGRAEIRVRYLESMPETFTNYYEIWDKRLSSGASSNVGRTKTMATNVGAIQAKISYQYQHMTTAATTTSDGGNTSNGDLGVPHAPSPPHMAQPSRSAPVTDEQLKREFLQHLKEQREKHSIVFHKYDEGEQDSDKLEHVGLDYPDESSSGSDDDNNDLGLRRRPSARAATQKDVAIEHQQQQRQVRTEEIKENNTSAIAKMSSTVSSWFGMTPTTSTSTTNTATSSGAVAPQPQPQPQPSSSSASTVKSKPAHEPDTMPQGLDVLADDEDSLKTFPLLDTLGSWAVNKETNQVLRTIGKLLAAFGQGFELSNLQILTGFTMLEKFYMELPRDRTWDVVEDLSEIELAAHFWKFSVASYGWKGLNFIGKGNGYISDAMRDHSDTLSILEYLSIPKEDLLAYEFRPAQAFRPSYFIVRDRPTNSIVLVIRGTMSAFDTMTDLVCEYEQWRGGLVHRGMKSSAVWFFRHVAPKLVAYTNEHSTSALYIVGHSLGAAAASILTIMLLDFMDEFRKDKSAPFTLRCFGYAPACGLSLDLAEKYKDHIDSVVFADDVVSKLSYGSAMDLKHLIIASAEAAQTVGLSQLLWTGKPEGELWKAAFDRIAECRKRCLESLENPRLYVAGRIYQFWLDPAPHNETRIVIERTDAKRVSSEVIVRRSIVLDHLPTNFDVAFRRAREALMVGAGKMSEDGILLGESGERDIGQRLQDVALKKTTTRTGGEGHAVDEDTKR